MDSQKVDLFIMSNHKYFPETQIPVIRERLLGVDESRAMLVQSMQFKDPVVVLILSILPALCGFHGIDRLFIGDTGLGIGKLLTCGGLGIWTIVDWFLISDATRQKNLERLLTIL
ncbi:MAG: TM2 domain-containing protein [Bacteroidaceae bacterium]|nr:TM2 domain-containing protein [Bacteroidaceae bacterium]